MALERIKENICKTIIEELIKGPNTSDYISTIPEETKINSISQEGSKVILDLSADYSQSGENSEKELAKIYSIVNSLTEVKEIDEVEINVDGKLFTTKTRL